MADAVTGRSWRIARGPGAFAHARDLARQTLESWSWPHDRIEVVVLLVSELVTNAHRHAGTDAWLHLKPTADGVRLTVRDASPEQPAQRTPDLEADVGGFGLHILDHLATRWGVETHTDGKHIWAQVPSSTASPR
ncbi:ATP-binding protein [Streptomyces flavidovirens]|uniref:ATP-binding protein n=1 Tax=Streptomyces flavidovirens TaxID=67298 RepID=UPI00048CD91A|nr:ATP-binding protein [Streptomyces flavidovirens]